MQVQVALESTVNESGKNFHFIFWLQFTTVTTSFMLL